MSVEYAVEFFHTDISGDAKDVDGCIAEIV